MLSAAERSGKIKTENCPQELFQTVLGPKARLQQIWNNCRLFSKKFQNEGKEIGYRWREESGAVLLLF